MVGATSAEFFGGARARSKRIPAGRAQVVAYRFACGSLCGPFNRPSVRALRNWA
jgi:hypothetical protein